MLARVKPVDANPAAATLLATREVRTVRDLRGLDGLVIPGGESTAIAKIATRFGRAAAGADDDMFGGLRRWIAEERKPVWGTCAGLIFLADHITEGAKVGGQPVIGGLDIDVSRNFFGKQVHSFEAETDAPPSSHPSPSARDGEGGNMNDAPYPGIFIRAPAVLRVGDGVKTLATVATNKSKTGSVAVAVEKGHLLGTAFHPELVDDDLRWHEYFVRKCEAARQVQQQAGP